MSGENAPAVSALSAATNPRAPFARITLHRIGEKKGLWSWTSICRSQLLDALIRCAHLFVSWAVVHELRLAKRNLDRLTVWDDQEVCLSFVALLFAGHTVPVQSDKGHEPFNVFRLYFGKD